MPVIDKARVRVLVVIVLLIVAATALHGYLPGGQPSARVQSIGSLGGLFAVVAMLTVSMAVIAIVVTTSRMAWVVWLACAVVATEVLSVVLANREAVPRVSGVALALAFVAAQWLLGRGVKSKSIDAAIDDPGLTMNRWVERTKSQITWSDTTRADWDRRLRPMLARQFELATKRPRARDPKAFEATGRVLFGDELWAWVDPENISRTGAREKGPGRATLTDIIERLERL